MNIARMIPHSVGGEDKKGEIILGAARPFLPKVTNAQVASRA